MFHIVLYQPVIPQNTGSIARLCACTGSHLHLIHPLGFDTSSARVKRAGLDYWDHVAKTEHADWEAFLATQQPRHLFFLSKKATKSFTEVSYPEDSYLVLGSETQGLPDTLHAQYAERFFQIPMRTNLVRSLNLAQAAAVVVYEALRQNAFEQITSCTESVVLPSPASHEASRPGTRHEWIDL